MNKKSEFPTQEDLDQAFHFLHEQITRISVVEEVEMIKKDRDGQEK
jgi:hypothetical protein